MIRTLDPAFLNSVARDCAGQLGGETDLAPLVSNPLNYTFVNDHGGFIFHYLGGQQYELHTLFRPGGRGRDALLSAAWAFRYLFTRTDGLEIVTKAAATNPAADFMARRAGFRELFRRAQAYADGSDLTYFTLSFDEWRGLDATLVDEGHAFHEMIEAAKATQGSALPTHPDDEAHDRAAGASALMAKAGQHQKAVWTYNRWALFAGYQTIELIALNLIDVRDAVLDASGGELRVIFCR